MTGCIVHGIGVFLYLADEGMPTGASWVIEVVPLLQPPAATFFPFLQLTPYTSSPAFAQLTKVMRSIDRAFVDAQAKNRSLPSEFLG